MFQKILVAVDGSEYSRRAVDYGMELAEKFGGSITLVHVFSATVPVVTSMDTMSGPSITPPVSSEMAAKITEEAEKRGRRILDEAEKLVKSRGISVESILAEGDVVREITRLAQEKNVDLIVSGHRGQGRLREVFLGSVSEGLSHKATCPVLIVK
jgi:nucleotide-binding universal stress UspA family protein